MKKTVMALSIAAVLTSTAVVAPGGGGGGGEWGGGAGKRERGGAEPGRDRRHCAWRAGGSWRGGCVRGAARVDPAAGDPGAAGAGAEAGIVCAAGIRQAGAGVAQLHGHRRQLLRRPVGSGVREPDRLDRAVQVRGGQMDRRAHRRRDAARHDARLLQRDQAAGARGTGGIHSAVADLHAGGDWAEVRARACGRAFVDKRRRSIAMTSASGQASQRDLKFRSWKCHPLGAFSGGPRWFAGSHSQVSSSNCFSCENQRGINDACL